MAHMALARKYRPRHFGEMVGQPHVVQALGNALRSQRLHHAYLFTGTRGIGKTTISRILAKSLNCVGADGTGGITDTPCGVCHVCQQIDDGRFADYIELDAASNRGVDDIQSVLEQALYKPVDGRLKVLMVDEVHMLSSTAFNAMLKTLEEPPDYLKFVLATTDPQKVPVTVLSRCLQFNLRPMPPATIAQHLQGLLQHEAVAAEAGALALLGRAARGSMRDALSLTDQAIAHGNGELTEAAVRDMLGLVDETWGVQLLQALAAGDGAAVVQQVDTLRELGQSAQAVLDALAERLHGVALLQLADAAPESADPTMADLAQALGADETQLLYSLCLQGRQDLTWSPDEYAGLNMVLLRFLAFGGGSKKKHQP
ncbi:MAG: DNA polymerase III subunit gamma/tau [Burkholderiaceae bacterium]